MRRNNGDNTNLDILGDGSNIPGFSDGTPDTFEPLQELNSNASEINAKFMNDAQENVKIAGVEGNGAPGPAPGDPSDDQFELSSAVNGAANTYSGASSFSSFATSEGLIFSVAAGLTVNLSPGIFVLLGKKYHATAAKLGAFTVQVGGADAGTGSQFTLLASRDHYVSIGVDTDEDTIQIQVRDVAFGAAPPAVPTGTFVFAILVTDGATLDVARFPAHGPRIITGTSSGWSFERPGLSGSSGAIIPFPGANGNVGALATEANPLETDGGAFIGTVFQQRVHVRTPTSSGRREDRSTKFTDFATTSGAVSATMDVVDLDDLPNSSIVEVQAVVVAYSDSNQAFTHTVARMARKTSAGAMGLVGSLRSITGPDDPGGLGVTVTIVFLAGNVVQIQVTGVAATDLTWVAKIETTEMRARV